MFSASPGSEPARGGSSDPSTSTGRSPRRTTHAPDVDPTSTTSTVTATNVLELVAIVLLACVGKMAGAALPARAFGRIVRSALHQAEQAPAARIVDRLPVDVDSRLRALVAAEVPDDDAGHCVYRGRMENRIRHRNGPPASMGA